MFLAIFPTVFVETESNVAPTTPPRRGIVLPKFITPFSPNFVSSRKPTFLLIAIIVLPLIFLIAFSASFFPTTIPTSH